jgi:hypothetical protein
VRTLLDINVLIALLDQDHSLHRQASRWFGAKADDGWASCPITQNGCVRIMSHPSYPNPLPVGAIMDRLGDAIATAQHQFWADDVSLLDPHVADRTRIHAERKHLVTI